MLFQRNLVISKLFNLIITGIITPWPLNYGSSTRLINTGIFYWMGINIVRLQCRLGNSNGERNKRNKQTSKRTTIFDVDSLFKFNFIYFFIDIIYLFIYLIIYLFFFLSFFLSFFFFLSFSSFFLSFFLYLFTVNPLSSPREGGGGAYLFQAHLRGGGLIWERGLT